MCASHSQGPSTVGQTLGAMLAASAPSAPQTHILNPPSTPSPFLLFASASSNLKKWQLLLCQRANPPISIFSNHTNSWVRFCLKLNIEVSKSQIQSFCHISVAVAAISFSTFLDILIGEILKASNGLKQKSRKNPHFGLFKSDMFLTSF